MVYLVNNALAYWRREIFPKINCHEREHLLTGIRFVFTRNLGASRVEAFDRLLGARGVAQGEVECSTSIERYGHANHS